MQHQMQKAYMKYASFWQVIFFYVGSLKNFFKGTWQWGGFSWVSAEIGSSILIDPLHYLSSSSDFGFDFAEIFIIEKQLPDSPSRGVGKIAYRYNFSKPLNKSMVIVHYIPGLFFAKLIF